VSGHATSVGQRAQERPRGGLGPTADLVHRTDARGTAGLAGARLERLEPAAQEVRQDLEQVLGERTERLIAQLEKMSGERNEDAKEQESEEDFYAATQRQASQVDFESITAQWSAQREAVVAPGGTPLSYREAVKQYFLRLHAKDE
jgi:glutamine amidotransferase-like uncharacterized protein